MKHKKITILLRVVLPIFVRFMTISRKISTRPNLGWSDKTGVTRCVVTNLRGRSSCNQGNLKGGGRIFHHSNQVSNTNIHELLGGFPIKINLK